MTTDDLAAARGIVNPHYLEHVVATAQSHEVAASEDIIAGNGIKLIAKGTRIDSATCDRLLEHKLRKPLEDCIQVVDGVTAARLESVAESLLQKHPLLQALCASERARSVPASLGALTLSMPLQSLLTVYADTEGRLEHAVGVAMMVLSLARRLLPADIGRHRLLSIAGLMHDVGEVYLDPLILQKGMRLDAAKWRHIATHPLIGHRVLRNMAGAGPVVADAVLLHHERLDGFGYPRNVEGEAFTLDGQIVAASEWLMAMVESESTPLMRARMAERLIPGEFSAALLAVVAAAARAAPDVPVELSSVPPLEEAVPRIVRLADTLRRFDDSRTWIDELITESGGALGSVLEAGVRRTLRIQASFSSTGIDGCNAAELLRSMAALQDPGVYAEIMTVVGEMEWRMRELERSQRLRASLLSPPDQSVMADLISRLRGSSVVVTAAVA